MSRVPASRTGGIGPKLGALLAAVLGLWLLASALQIPLTTQFSVDEYEYAHGAWLTAQGEVIYRDFFEAHHPLIHQVMALPWLLLDDDPVNILVLRLAMVPIFLLLTAAAVAVNRGRGRLTAWLTPVVILGTGSLVNMGLEVRPDPLAFALFLTGVACLHLERLPPRLRGFLAGLLTTLAVWGSQKVVYYGIVLAAALIADLLDRRPERRQFLGDWRTFLGGAALVAAGLAAYLTLSGSWAAWIRWALVWVAEHQRSYPGFPWTKNFLPFFGHHSWLFAAAGVGTFNTARRVARTRRAADPDLLLLGLLVSTLASAAWQTAGYMYSYIPFAAMLAIFAARGVADLYGALTTLRQSRPAAALFGIALVTLLLVGEAVHVKNLYRISQRADNTAQLETLRRLGELTDPGDPVFDIAGKRVARPGVHFFYFTDAVIRAQEAERLATEIPPAIVELGCTAYIHDNRWHSLPPSLRAFVLAHFQPITREIWLWGRTYPTDPGGQPRQENFLAVRSGRYFVHPGTAVAEGRVQIDGRPPAAAIFDLERGLHQVEISGDADLAILWLPRDGRTWEPLPHPVRQ